MKITLMSVVLCLLLHLNILEFLNFKIDKTDSVIAAQSWRCPIKETWSHHILWTNQCCMIKIHSLHGCRDRERDPRPQRDGRRRPGPGRGRGGTGRGRGGRGRGGYNSSSGTKKQHVRSSYGTLDNDSDITLLQGRGTMRITIPTDPWKQTRRQIRRPTQMLVSPTCPQTAAEDRDGAEQTMMPRWLMASRITPQWVKME